MSNALYRIAKILAKQVGLPPSQLFPSPSKFFLLRKLVCCLDQSKGMSIGLDAACADFKYRSMFKTESYVGLDLDPYNLSRGLEFRARRGDLGVLADLLLLKNAPGVADVVVSTHTLASLAVHRRIDGVKALAASVVKNGTLFFNLPRESDCETLHSYLEERFGVVQRIVYAAPVFMRMENYFAHRTSSKNPFALTVIGLAIVLSYLLSYVEEVVWVRKSGVSVIYWCRNKKGSDIESRLDALRRLKSGI